MSRIVLAAALAALLPLAGCGGAASAEATPGAGAADAVPVSVANADVRDVPLQLRAIGTVESPASVVLKARLAGQVAEVRLQEGDDVRAGDVLLLLDSRPAQAAVQLAEATLARDRAMAQDAALASEQMESVVGTRAVAQRTAQQARATADAAQAGVAADEAALDLARLQLDWCTIRAPFDGRTGQLGVRVGSVVKENDTELLTINQIAPIRVSFAVPQDRLPEIGRHQASAPLVVQVTTADGGTVEGRLTFIDNAVETTSGTIRLMGTFENADRRLWPGQYVDVALDIAVDQGALVVPTSAVQSGQKGQYVFVVRDDRAELRSVTVLRRAGDLTLIGDGVQAGESVVTDGQLRLVDGTRVRASTVPPP